MKISKLFHWLYASLMLLPIILIPVFMIYSHRHVLTETKDVDIQYKYQSNEVNTVDDLVEGNIYTKDNFEIRYSTDTNLSIPILYFDGMENLLDFNDISLDEIYYDYYDSKNNNGLVVLWTEDYATFIFTNNDCYTSILVDLESSTGLEYISFTNVVFQINDVNAWKNFFEAEGYSDDDLPQYTDYNVIESVSVQDTNTDIMQVFENNFTYAVNENPLFSWATNSLLSEPITYASGLFNIPSDSPINTLLSYWCAISVVYLIFDVFMYVPLLIHSRIDKARVE